LAANATVLALEEIMVRTRGATILDVGAFAVDSGESVAVVGPNGAGKTTLLHVAALLRRPDAGRVTIRGEAATAKNGAVLRRALSVVFQEPLLFDTTVLDNAAAGLRFAGVPRAEAERRATRWLERFGVGHLAARRARGLSGGEAGRVALARAFATDPALLLLDEPFAALDAPTRVALLPELRAQLNGVGTAAVLVTHDLAEAFAFGDRIAVMNGGRVLASAAPAELLAHPPSREVAALLGIENILPATVVAVDGSCLLLDLLPGGPRIQAEAADTPLRPGQGVTITLPAIAARVVAADEAAPPGWNRLDGRIAAATSLPAGVRLTLATPAPVAAMAPWQPDARGWLSGDRASVTFPPSAVQLLAEAGESRRGR
jgi:tungstate transport system ATP-binding protein